MWIQTKVSQQTTQVHMLNKQKKMVLNSVSQSESDTFFQVTLQNSSQMWIYFFFKIFDPYTLIFHLLLS